MLGWWVYGSFKNVMLNILLTENTLPYEAMILLHLDPHLWIYLDISIKEYRVDRHGFE